MPRTTPRGRRRHARPAVFLASAVLHAAGLFLLAHHLSQVDPHPEARAVQLSIVTLAKRPPRPERPPSEQKRQNEQQAPAPLFLPARPSPPTEDVRPGSPDADSQAASGGQRVLRGLTGCDHPRLLTAEERRACETRRWARAAPDPRLNLDLAGRYVENPEPYLVRKPKDGCKVRATGDVGPMGDSGHGRVGIGCAFSF